MNYTLPQLPYAYEALEPHFDTETMKIHHGRHHQAYVDNLNKAIADATGELNELEEILQVISTHTAAIRNNGGGHYNHSLFWKTLSPKAKLKPENELIKEIDKTFGSLDSLKSEINTAALTHFGSGWAWLVVKYNGKLSVTVTANQDSPLMDTHIANQGYPILGVDVWEHAYYLQHQNQRASYLEAFWSVLDWIAVEENYAKALKKIK